MSSLCCFSGRLSPFSPHPHWIVSGNAERPRFKGFSQSNLKRCTRHPPGLAWQQSSVASNPGLFRSQLSTPQTRSPLQSASLSQSPSPSMHWLVAEQQESPPLHISATLNVVKISLRQCLKILWKKICLSVPRMRLKQQSSVESKAGLARSQLSTPQTRLPSQSLSLSQSPSPSTHCFNGEQQELPPLHVSDSAKTCLKYIFCV